MKKSLKSIAFLAVIVMIASVFAGCGGTDPVIKVGNDEVPSLYSVVGERKITGTSSNVENGVRNAQKTYQSGAVTREDIESYFTALRETHGYIVTMDTEENGTAIRAQLAKESVDAGKIVVVDIDFDSAGSTVLSYTVGEGTLNVY